MESEHAKVTMEDVRKTSEADEEDSIIPEEEEKEEKQDKEEEEDEEEEEEEEDEDEEEEEEEEDEEGGEEEEEEEGKTRRLSSSSSVSSSSSSSSSCRASLEHDIVENSHLSDSIPKSKSDGDLSQGEASIPTPNCPAQTPEGGMSSTSASPPQVTSPPVQTMGHPSEYDPGRIPASVFSSKPANASEWSVASNDSLFSIHVGNNSFTKDMFRSGELRTLEELNNNAQSSLLVSEAKPSNELCSLPVSLPPLMEVPANEEGSAKSSCVSTIEKDMGASKGATTSRLSNESRHSTSSFAFPVMESEGGKASPLARVEEKPEMPAQESVDTTPKSTTGGWFSWCSCLPRCC